MRISTLRRSVLAGLLAAPFYARSAIAAPIHGVGQMLLAGFRGTTKGEPEVDLICDMLRSNLLAGVVLLQRNITSPTQLSDLTATLREASADLPPIIAVDQEGGAVARLKKENGFKNWISARDLGQSGMSDTEILSYYQPRATALATVGITLNLAPVVDLTVDAINPGVGSFGRAYSADPQQAARLAEIFIRAHRAAEVRTSLKHFPGHGSAQADSHSAYTDINGTWSEAELLPYHHLMKNDLIDTVMQGHLLHQDFSDDDGIPASLSRKSVRFLREKIGFQGPVITDSLQMKAVRSQFSALDAGVAAVNAGNSLIIYSDISPDYSPTLVRDMVEALSRHPSLEPETVAGEIRRVNAFRQAQARPA